MPVKQSDVKSRLDAARNKAAQLLGQIRAAQQTQADALAEIANIDGEAILLLHASDYLQSLSVKYQATIQDFMGKLVTAGVRDIFCADWTVEFREARKAGQKSLDIFLIQGTLEAEVPDATGGGVTQVIAVLTQLSMVYLMRSKTRQIVVLDESLSHLAAQYLPNAASVLKETSRRLGIQLLLVTHQDQLVEQADLVYELARTPHGTTKISRM